MPPLKTRELMFWRYNSSSASAASSTARSSSLERSQVNRKSLWKKFVLSESIRSANSPTLLMSWLLQFKQIYTKHTKKHEGHKGNHLILTSCTSCFFVPSCRFSSRCANKAIEFLNHAVP